MKLFVEAFARGIGPAAIAAAITFIGIEGNESIQAANIQLQRIAQETRKANVVIEITARQKALDVDIGMRLLEKMLRDFLGPVGPDAGGTMMAERILLLKLVALNLWDVPVHLKPLYENVDRLLTQEDLRLELRGAAQAVARKQAFRLAAGGGLDIPKTVVEVGETKEFPEVSFGLSGKLKLALHELEDAAASVSLVFEEEFESKKFGPFNVTYFDAPLVDNAKHGAVRVAVILLRTSREKGEAEFRIVVFDDDLATDRIDIQEMTRELKKHRSVASPRPAAPGA